MNSLERRSIGETPPSLGGVVAYAHIPPTWKGECTLHYTLVGLQLVVRFPCYEDARTAAIRGIYCPDLNICEVHIRDVRATDKRAPLFVSAGAWYDALKQPPLSKVIGM